MSVTTTPPDRQQSMSLVLRSDRIRKRATERGADTVAKMAALFGVTRQHMYLLLKHTYLPSAETADRMAAALEMPTEDLYDRVVKA